MALISCPQCGKEVSNKAKVCPGCGNVLIKEEPPVPIVCKECGAEVPAEVKICPNCGCPIETESEEETPQKVEITSVKIPTVKKSAKKYIISAVIAIALIVVAVVLIKMGSTSKANSDYSKNLEEATTTMLVGASNAEDAGNLIKSVWYNTIYEKRDSTTDKYTRNKYGSFNSDFNDSLTVLFADSSFSSSIGNITSNQNSVSELMKSLQNPPEKYEEAYSSIKALYDAYLDLTGLVVDPSGSFQTFSNDFNDADSAVLKCYKAMDMYINN